MLGMICQLHQNSYSRLPQLFDRSCKQLSSNNGHAIRRVFDIGSGSIKCQVAKVDTKTCKIVETLFDDNIQVLFQHDLKTSTNLTQETINKGSQAIQVMLDMSNHFSHMVSIGVATEAFRKAQNGLQTINQYRDLFQLPISIISPVQEARLGFESAAALCSRVSRSRLVAWDCGAGSFQIARENTPPHIDAHGSSTMLKLALRLQQQHHHQQQHQSLNPFDRPRLQSLLDCLHKELKPVPQWIHAPESEYVAIGTSQSIFNQQRLLSHLSRFGQADVEKTLNELMGMNDQEICAFEQARYTQAQAELPKMQPYNAKLENSQYVVPKLALLLGVMRKCEINDLEFYQTNGNCSALLIDSHLWSHDGGTTAATPQTTSVFELRSTLSDNDDATAHKLPTTPVMNRNSNSSQSAAPEGTFDKAHFLTVNWHLEKDCNYKCKFCYAHFRETQQNLTKNEGFRLLEAFAKKGFYKVNFAGGEPLLNSNLGAYLKHASSIGLKTSIITNASKMTATWLTSFGRYIDQIGVSCDSLDDSINQDLGRGFGAHVQVTKRAFHRIKELNQILHNEIAGQASCDSNIVPSKAIKVKLNTVVMKPNYMENWSDFIKQCGVTRWKIFKILRIEGENDQHYDQLAISDDQFQLFVDRHKHLANEGVVMAPEDNDEMTTSYMMVTPDGMFYQNTGSRYVRSQSILDVGINAALDQVGFEYSKFQARGGEYELK